MAGLTERIARLERQTNPDSGFLFVCDLSAGEVHRADLGEVSVWRHQSEASDAFRARVLTAMAGSTGLVVFS